MDCEHLLCHRNNSEFLNWFVCQFSAPLSEVLQLHASLHGVPPLRTIGPVFETGQNVVGCEQSIAFDAEKWKQFSVLRSNFG